MTDRDVASTMPRNDFLHPPPHEWERFTDEAAAAIAVEVERYASDLTTRARTHTQAEVVLKRDVDKAIRDLRPTRAKETARLAADWAKRFGFLFIGLSVAQYNAIRVGQDVRPASITWLAFQIVAASVLTTTGLLLDRFALVDQRN